MDWTELAFCMAGPPVEDCVTENALTSAGGAAAGLAGAKAPGTLCISRCGTIADLTSAGGADVSTLCPAAGPAAGARADGLLLNIRAGPLAKGFVEGEMTGLGAGGARGLGESLGLIDGPHSPTAQRDGWVNSSPRDRDGREGRPMAVEGPGDIAKVPGKGRRNKPAACVDLNLGIRLGCRL